MTGTFFGLPFSIPFNGVALMLLGAAIFSAWVVWKAIGSGVHDWRGNKTIRAESPRMFFLDVAVTALIGFCAFLGAVGIYFDLGLKP